MMALGGDPSLSSNQGSFSSDCFFSSETNHQNPLNTSSISNTTRLVSQINKKNNNSINLKKTN